MNTICELLGLYYYLKRILPNISEYMSTFCLLTSNQVKKYALSNPVI